MKKTVKLEQIKLDVKNPRFLSRKNNNNDNVANFMLKHSSAKSIFDMTKDIIENGLSPLDVIAVFKENNEYVALDGNRRTLSLKIIFDNKNITLPIDLKELLEENTKKINELISNGTLDVEVYVFPNRAEAKKWLQRKHTSDIGGASSQGWPTLEKKIFNDEQLAKIISRNAQEANISYDDYALNISYTVWERFFASDFSRKWLGMDYSKETQKFMVINEGQLHERMNAIVAASKDKKVNFSTVNKNKDKMKTIKLINKDYLQDTNYDTEINNTPNKKPKTKKIFSNVLGQIKNEKMRMIIVQMQKINIKNYKDLIAIAIRSLVEISIIEYLTQVQNKSKTWFNSKSLGEQIEEVIDSFKNIKTTNKTTIKSIRENVNSIIFYTNANIHDVEYMSTTKELNILIGRISILLEEIWKEID